MSFVGPNQRDKDQNRKIIQGNKSTLPMRPTPPHNKNVQGQNFSFVSPGPERKFWDFFGKIWKVNKIVHVNKKVP